MLWPQLDIDWDHIQQGRGLRPVLHYRWLPWVFGWTPPGNVNANAKLGTHLLLLLRLWRQVHGEEVGDV